MDLQMKPESTKILTKDDAGNIAWKMVCFLFGADPDKTQQIIIPKDSIAIK